MGDATLCVALPTQEKPLMVCGHRERIKRGPSTAEGKATLIKNVTGWEALLHMKIVLQMPGPASGLASFTPPLVAILPPEEHAACGWLYVEEGDSRPVIEELCRLLSERSARAHGYCKELDEALWNACFIDVVGNFDRPCVLDLKIGKIRHSPYTSPEKVQRILMKQHGRTQLVRVCGAYHWYCPSAASGGGDFVGEFLDKASGYNLHTSEEHRDIFRAFFSSTIAMKDVKWSKTDAPDKLRVAARVGACRQRICELLNYFKSLSGSALLTQTAFVSTSLLFVYDAAEAVDGRADCSRANVYLIDFARCSDRRLNFSEEEVGFVQGLQSTVQLLE
ncbi:hypothetical protein TRVL_03507 [Trypanosoma vivax]|nr:hypothetical protein TRVL_03507 [Trypanosoma vivax]